MENVCFPSSFKTEVGQDVTIQVHGSPTEKTCLLSSPSRIQEQDTPADDGEGGKGKQEELEKSDLHKNKDFQLINVPQEAVSKGQLLLTLILWVPVC